MKTNTLTNISTNKFKFTKLIKLTVIIFISLILQNIAMAGTFSPKTTKKIIGKGKKMSILMNKPKYYLKVAKGLTNLIVTFNGEPVNESYTQYNSENQFPINKYITSGKNTFAITMLAWERDKQVIVKEAMVVAELILKTPTNQEIVIARINYQNNQASTDITGTYQAKVDNNNPTRLMKHMGDIENITNTGLVKVSELEIIPRDYYQADKVHGITARQTVELDTPFPRWAYLDGEDVMLGEGEYYYLKNYGFPVTATPDYIKLEKRSDIQELMNICDGMVELVSHGQYNDFIDMFAVRNKEFDTANYLLAGTTENDFFHSLKQKLTSGKFELSLESCKNSPLSISDTGKTIMLDGGVFLYGIKENKGIMNVNYHIRFSKINGKWVITH